MSDEHPVGHISHAEAYELAMTLGRLDTKLGYMDDGLDLVAIAAGNGESEQGMRLLQKAQKLARENRTDLRSLAKYLRAAYEGDAAQIPDIPEPEPDVPVDVPPDVVAAPWGPRVSMDEMTMVRVPRLDDDGKDIWERREIAPHAFQEGDTCIHYESGVDLHKHYVQGANRCAFQHWASRGIVDGAYFTDCVFHARTWIFRDYRVARNLRFRHCRFGPVKQEHGCYINVEGGFPEDVCIEWDACLWEDIASQPVQIVTGEQRAHEYPADADFGPGGLLWLHDGHIRFVSNDMEDGKVDAVGGGTSFGLSYFEGKHPVLIERTDFDNSMLSKAFGWLLCRGSIDPTYERSCRVVGDGNKVALPNNNRPIAQIDATFGGPISGCITGYQFLGEGGQRYIDLKGKVEDFKIADCDGNAVIRVNGTEHGPVSQGIEL